MAIEELLQKYAQLEHFNRVSFSFLTIVLDEIVDSDRKYLHSRIVYKNICLKKVRIYI